MVGKMHFNDILVDNNVLLRDEKGQTQKRYDCAPRLTV